MNKRLNVRIKIKAKTLILVLILLTGCISCSSPSNFRADGKPSLYQKIGEKPAIDNIIDNLIDLIGQDKVVFSHFAQSNVSHFKEKLAVYLCHITNGPCEYNGDTMQDIHRGMYIDTNQFNHFVELFIGAMDASDISYPIQNELLARLALLRESIIKM